MTLREPSCGVANSRTWWRLTFFRPRFLRMMLLLEAPPNFSGLVSIAFVWPLDITFFLRPLGFLRASWSLLRRFRPSQFGFLVVALRGVPHGAGCLRLLRLFFTFSVPSSPSSGLFLLLVLRDPLHVPGNTSKCSTDCGTNNKYGTDSCEASTHSRIVFFVIVCCFVLLFA